MPSHKNPKPGYQEPGQSKILNQRDDEGSIIFRPWITHPKTGKRIYPKRGKVFPIRVTGEKEAEGLRKQPPAGSKDASGKKPD